MPQILLVNPSPRRKATTSTRGAKKMAARKKPRTAAQRAATRRMIAANRARRGRTSAPRRRRRVATVIRDENPAKRRRRKRATPGYSRKRRPVVTAARAARAARTLRYRKLYRTGNPRRRRRNPIGMGDIVDTKLIPAATGAGGALLLDIAFNLAPLPDVLRAGIVGQVVRVAGAIGMGMAVGKVAGRRIGDRMAVGALTVTFYNLGRTLLGGKLPGLGDGEYIGEYIGAPPMLLPDGTIGEYIGDDGMMGADDIGYIESGMQVGDPEMSGFETGVYR